MHGFTNVKSKGQATPNLVNCELGDHYSTVGQCSGGWTLRPELSDFRQDVRLFGSKTIFVSETLGVLSVIDVTDCPEFFIA